MTEVLRYLIQNVLEAIGENNEGEIIMTTFRNDRWATISLRDNGSGIEEENLSRVFTPFYSTKPSVKNWGWALPIVVRLCLPIMGIFRWTAK